MTQVTDQWQGPQDDQAGGGDTDQFTGYGMLNSSTSAKPIRNSAGDKTLRERERVNDRCRLIGSFGMKS